MHVSDPHKYSMYVLYQNYTTDTTTNQTPLLSYFQYVSVVDDPTNLTISVIN